MFSLLKQDNSSLLVSHLKSTLTIQFIRFIYVYSTFKEQKSNKLTTHLNFSISLLYCSPAGCIYICSIEKEAGATHIVI